MERGGGGGVCVGAGGGVGGGRGDGVLDMLGRLFAIFGQGIQFL